MYQEEELIVWGRYHLLWAVSVLLPAGEASRVLGQSRSHLCAEY